MTIEYWRESAISDVVMLTLAVFALFQVVLNTRVGGGTSRDKCGWVVMATRRER